ncbi:MAG: FAD-dependent oxidoreductase [Clostridiales bacterium]|nr:FAD-dependent oxidoreductase [Clostridiales bacterium]
MERRDVVIIGGGPAGLAAAVELKKRNIADVLIIEREKQLGGILRQCIHDGFGLTRFGESFSGPEYSQRFIDEAAALGIDAMTNATVIDLSPDKVVTVAAQDGLKRIQANAVILAMGCRERTRGALAIPGSRPSGIYTAGVAQSYMNLYNTMVGKEIVIMGSGDIGLIMARRFTLEGAHVKAVFEVLPYPSGLPRNIEQCLNDYDIPLYLSHSVINIVGDKRIEGVEVAQVDARMNPISGTNRYFPCDTLILSVGLIPENELSLAAGVELDVRTKGAFVDESHQTSVPGVFAAGNVLHVHDLVDFVSLEAESLAESAAQFIREGELPACGIALTPSPEIGHIIPQKISGTRDFQLSLRVRKPVGKCKIVVRQGEREIKSVSLPKAIPAEMIQFAVSCEKISSGEPIEVSVYER